MLNAEGDLRHCVPFLFNVPPARDLLFIIFYLLFIK